MTPKRRTIVSPSSSSTASSDCLFISHSLPSSSSSSSSSLVTFRPSRGGPDVSFSFPLVVTLLSLILGVQSCTAQQTHHTSAVPGWHPRASGSGRGEGGERVHTGPHHGQAVRGGRSPSGGAAAAVDEAPALRPNELTSKGDADVPFSDAVASSLDPVSAGAEGKAAPARKRRISEDANKSDARAPSPSPSPSPTATAPATAAVAAAAARTVAGGATMPASDSRLPASTPRPHRQGLPDGRVNHEQAPCWNLKP